MGALFMFSLVSAIAIIGGLYFWIKDRKDSQDRKANHMI